jgi:hypothetical protein
VARGDRERALALKLMMCDFIRQHPRCEERHRAALHLPERREAAAPS